MLNRREGLAEQGEMAALDGDDATAWERFRTDMRRRNLSPLTVRSRYAHLSRLATFLDPLGLLEATASDVEAWVLGLGVGPRTQGIYLSSVHAFYEWARRAGLANCDPTDAIARPRTARLVPRPIPADELAHALASATPRLRAWLALAAFQGFRCKEIAGLRGEDVLVHHNPPLIVVVDGKGGHQGVLPLNAIVERSLRVCGLPARGWLFCGRNGSPVSANLVSCIGNRYLHSLGIASTMHALRHFYGTAIWAATKDLRVTQEMLRHADPRTTTIYTAYDKEAAVRAVRDLDASCPTGDVDRGTYGPGRLLRRHEGV